MQIGFREKIILAGMSLALIIALWYFLFYASETARIEEINREIAQTEQQMREAKSSANNLGDLQAEVDSLEAELASMQRRILPKTELLQITEELQGKAAQFGLTISTISVDKSKLFGVEEGGSGFLWVPIEIGIEGEFFAFGKFLDTFPNFPFIIMPGEIKMTTDDTLYPKLSIFLVAYAYVSKT